VSSDLSLSASEQAAALSEFAFTPPTPGEEAAGAPCWSWMSAESFVLTLDECVRVNELLQKGVANSRNSDLVDLLTALQASKVAGKLKFIAESKLGTTVAKLGKHEDDQVKAAAAALKKAWAAVAQQAKASAPPKAKPEVKPETTESKPSPSTAPPASQAKPEVSTEAKAEAAPAAAASSSAEPVPLVNSSSMLMDVEKRPPRKTGDATRDMVRDKLQEAFEAGKQANARFLREQMVDTAEMAEEAEDNMDKTFGGTSAAYKSRFRSLMFNLKDKKNPEFIRMVMTGQLHVNDLATMEVREMASDEMKSVRDKAKENAKMALMDEKTYKQYAGKETQDGILKCPRCKSMKTEYIEVQTRSADEPTTKKCTCNNCDYRWKFC